MVDCKPLSDLTYMRTNILFEQCPTTLAEMEDMSFVPYASAIGILIYVLILVYQTFLI